MNRMTVWACACALAAAGCKKNAADSDAPIPADNTPVQHSDISPKPPKACGGAAFSIHYGDAYKTLREAEEYKPGLRDYYVRELSDRRNEYLLAGISPKQRTEWLTSHRIAEKDYPCFVPLFDELSAAAKRTLPKYRPRGYTHHESGEDNLISAAVKEQIPDAEVLGVGVKSPSWDIEKLNNGIPSLRYKYGMAWVKSATFDDGYCRIVYVNVVQDYSGGGSYGDSKGSYISMEPAGCP
jgi:hypothetical protein